jgi:hypothetical protein
MVDNNTYCVYTSEKPVIKEVKDYLERQGKKASRGLESGVRLIGIPYQNVAYGNMLFPKIDYANQVQTPQKKISFDYDDNTGSRVTRSKVRRVKKTADKVNSLYQKLKKLSPF